jgi:hypothetical protein
MFLRNVLPASSTLRIEIAHSSETLINIYQVTENHQRTAIFKMTFVSAYILSITFHH